MSKLFWINAIACAANLLLYFIEGDVMNLIAGCASGFVATLLWQLRRWQ